VRRAVLGVFFAGALLGGPIVLLGVARAPIAAVASNRASADATIAAIARQSAPATVMGPLTDASEASAPEYPAPTTDTSNSPTTAPVSPTPAATAAPVAHVVEVTTTTTAPVSTTTTAPPPPSASPVSATAVAAASTTTTTEPPPAIAAGSRNQETGEATWYSEAPAGYCASPNLPFGTVVHVTNNANGESTTCTVDDRMAPSPNRIVDLSTANFSQIANLSQGVIAVTITW
jgi:rare lipoprotein A (peptidoglycan hydrolase)